jgi:DNA-binding MarR family transcriptional regulator
MSASDAAPLEPLAPAQLTAYFALIEVGNLLQHAVDQQLREEGGLSYTQFQILAMLGKGAEGRERMTDIADQLVHSRSGLTYQVSQLADRGLVVKAASPEDERSVVVSLTEEGSALLDHVMRGHREVVRRLFLAPLSEGDVAQLGDVLSRVRDSIRADPPRSAAPRRKRG